MAGQFIPQGQTPLNIDPSTPWGQGMWGGFAGGSDQAGQYYTIQQFNKLFGRDPTQSELDQFSSYFMGADPNIANLAGGNQAISSYFNQQQQAANAPGQEASAIQAQIPIINQLVGAETKNLTDPGSSAYQNFSGLMNNMGITPSSGAFQAGLGSEIGQTGSDLMKSILNPIASTYSSGATKPFTSAMNQPDQLFGNNLQMQDMIQQMIAASGIAQQAQPSDLEKWGIPLGSAAIQGAGNAAKGTWICTQLKEEGLLTQEEVNRIHKHLFKARWKRPFKFLGYFLFGKLLVMLANRVGTHWPSWKPAFYDYVMRESDPIKAVDLYEEAFWDLYRVVKEREFSHGI